MQDPKIGEICSLDQIPVGAVFQACNTNDEPLDYYYVKHHQDWVYRAQRVNNQKWKRAPGAGGLYIGDRCKYIAEPKNVEPDPPDMPRPLKATIKVN